MNRWWSWNVALLLVALVAYRAPAQDKDKKDPAKKDDVKKDEPKKPATPAPMPDLAKGQKTTTITGELIHVESGKAGFRVKVPEYYVEVNEGEARAAIQEQANAQAALARRPPDVNAARNHLAAAEQHKAKIRQVKTRNKDLTFEAHEKAVVRLPGPKDSFDEMGNVKKYTVKELDALRGKDKLFDGEFTDLTNGQIVQVTIIVPKMPAKPLKKDDLQLEEPKLEALRIVVLRQPKVGK